MISMERKAWKVRLGATVRVVRIKGYEEPNNKKRESYEKGIKSREFEKVDDRCLFLFGLVF